MRLRRAARVAEVVVDAPPCTVVARLPDGRPIVLAGSAEEIWRALPAAADPPIAPADLADLVAHRAGVEAAAIAADVEAFAADLVAERVAERVAAQDGGRADR